MLWLVITMPGCAGGVVSAPSAPLSLSSGIALPCDAADPLANPPETEGDDAALRGRLSDLRIALDLARAKLKTLDRYAHWQQEKWNYDTRVGLGKQGHVLVAFDTPGATDQDIEMEVDVTRRAVVDVQLGTA